MKKVLAALTIITVILTCFLSACNSDAFSFNTSIVGDIPPRSGGYNGAIILPPDNHTDPYESIPENIKGQTVRYATWINHWENEGKVPFSNFYNDTGLNIELFPVPKNAYVDKLKSSIASGDIPDVFVCDNSVGGFPLTLEFAAPIDVVSTVDLNDPIWHKTMLEYATIDGHIYFLDTVGSPWNNSNLIFFNKSLFEDNGYKTPAEYYEEGNWTWNTMLKSMKDIKNLGDDFVGGYIDVEILSSSAGASFCVYNSETDSFESGVSKKELLMAYQWYDYVKGQSLLSTDGLESFKEGKCGLVMADIYGLKNTGHFKDMDWYDIGFTYLPSLEDGSNAKIASNFTMHGIVDGAPHANAAGYFLRYWLDPENYSDIFDTFISNKAANFYFELTNSEADDKYFNFDLAFSNLLGESSTDVFNKEIKKATFDDINTNLKAVSGKAVDACSKANEIIERLKAKNK